MVETICSLLSIASAAAAIILGVMLSRTRKAHLDCWAEVEKLRSCNESAKRDIEAALNERIYKNAFYVEYANLKYAAEAAARFIETGRVEEVSPTEARLRQLECEKHEWVYKESTKVGSPGVLHGLVLQKECGKCGKIVDLSLEEWLCEKSVSLLEEHNRCENELKALKDKKESEVNNG